MIAWLAAALAGDPCALEIVQADVHPAAVGWREDLELTFVAEAGCEGVDLYGPPGVRWERWRGRITTAAGSGRRFDEVRVERVAVTPDGGRHLRIHLEDLHDGGLATLSVTRWHDRPGALDFDLAAWGTPYLAVRARRGVVVEASGAGAAGPWWILDAAGERLTVAHPWHQPAAPVVALDPSDAAALPGALSAVVRLPPGADGDLPIAGSAGLRRGAMTDAAVAATLAAAGLPADLSAWAGAAPAPLRWRATLDVVDDRGPRLVQHATATRGGPGAAWAMIPLPPGARVDHVDRGGAWRVEADAAWLVLPADVDAAELVVSAPLVDAWGPLPVPAEVDGAFRAADGTVLRSDGVVWWAEALAGRPALTDTDRLLRELGHRQRAVSLPEPALPLGTRGRVEGWSLAADLPAVLAERAAVARLPRAPDAPRPLYRARRSGVLTPTEAALVVGLYAGQGRLGAEVWYVAGAGAAHPPTLAGYDDALVRVAVPGGDEVRWLDPACRPCAPFEVRPHLLGRAAVRAGVEGGAQGAIPTVQVRDGLPDGVVRAPDGALTMAPPAGLRGGLITLARGEDGQVRWTLHGAAALALRLAGALPGAASVDLGAPGGPASLTTSPELALSALSQLVVAPTLVQWDDGRTALLGAP